MGERGNRKKGNSERERWREREVERTMQNKFYLRFPKF